MVECTRGGYDGRFDRGENTKSNFEKRTQPGQWLPDASLFAMDINSDTVSQIKCPHTRAVAMQEIEAQRRRKNYKRLTRPEHFCDEHWSY